MTDVSNRIASLSPERRKALELLLRRQAGRAEEQVPAVSKPALDDDPDEGELVLTDDYSVSPEDTKRNNKRFYDRVTRQLNASEFGACSYFLNYGYVSDGSREFARASLPAHFINRTSVKLVLETIGDCDLNKRRMLDVGCGRGGTIFVAKTFFNPEQLVGIDMSSAAIEFNCKTHRDPRIRFFEGDAEQLTFDDGSFDVVTNVESSHAYPSIHAFYSGVFRVLVPGGHFLYTDLLPAQKMEMCLGLLKHTGFVVQRDRDITSNVLLSCDEVAQRRVGAFHVNNDQQLMGNFLAAPGSLVYEQMRSRSWTYRILKLQKPL